MSSLLAYTNELYNLDPSNRVEVTLYDNEEAGQHGEKLFESVKNDLFMIRLKQIAWGFYREQSGSTDASNGASASPTKSVATLLQETGLREVISNAVIRLYEKNLFRRKRSQFNNSSVYSRHSKEETIDGIRQIRIEWEQGINEELIAIASETARPYLQMRPPGKFDKFVMGDQAALLGDTTVSKDSVKFLFDSEDLLETGVSVRSNNIQSTALDSMNKILGLIKIHLLTPSLEALCKRFKELGSDSSHLGMDENQIGGSKFSSLRHEEGEAIAHKGTAISARRYMRRGVPPSLRRLIWRIALCLPPEVSHEETKRYRLLRSYCDHLDILTDRLYMHDVENVVDDPRFFVFEEELKEVIMCFSRDDWVRENALYEIHIPIFALMDSKGNGIGIISGDASILAKSENSNSNNRNTTSNKTKQAPTKDTSNIKGNSNANESKHKQGAPQQATAPHASVHPFLGLSIYSAPLCYIFRNKASLYSMTRLLWTRIWCRMNVISGDTGTLLHVCATFENLLMSIQPTLFLHLVRLGVQPILIAMPWLQFGFVGLLEMDQILHLWDRLIGYQDPYILALLAVAVFVVRSEAVLAVSSANEACSILMEGSRLRVVPLLQMMVFKGGEGSGK